MRPEAAPSNPGACRGTTRGFSGTAAAQVVGITYRQLDYWARTDLVRPSLADAAGSGTQRRYSYRDLLELKVIKSLLDAGIRLESVRDVVQLPAQAPRRATSPPPTSCSTAARSVLCRGDELIDLVRKGQGVLNIVPLGGGQGARLDAAILDVAAAHGDGQLAVGTRRLTALGALERDPLRPQLRAAVRQAARLLRHRGSTSRARSSSSSTSDGRPLQAFTPDFYLRRTTSTSRSPR